MAAGSSISDCRHLLKQVILERDDVKVACMLKQQSWGRSWAPLPRFTDPCNSAKHSAKGAARPSVAAVRRRTPAPDASDRCSGSDLQLQSPLERPQSGHLPQLRATAAYGASCQWRWCDWCCTCILHVTRRHQRGHRSAPPHPRSRPHSPGA